MPEARESLVGAVVAIRDTDHGIEVEVRLRNQADRALHYISDCRGMSYDEAARHLTLRLSDEGRSIVVRPGNREPQFRHVDPGAEALLTLALPAQITKFAPPPDPERRQLAFVKQRIADAEQVTVQIAWSDVPFYEDPRQSVREMLPAVRWQQHRLDVSAHRAQLPM